MRMRIRLVASLIMTAILLLCAMPATQADSNFVWRPDKGNHLWCGPTSTSSTLWSTANAASNHMEAQTVVNGAYQACDDSTDVVWEWSPDEPNAFGQTLCMKLRTDGTGNCDRFVIYLFKKRIDASEFPSSQLRKTACHELGHSLGVSHYEGSATPGSDTQHSCMRSLAVPKPNLTWHTSYGPHHINSHINPWFS